MMAGLREAFMHASPFVKQVMAGAEALRLSRKRHNAVYGAFYRDINFANMMESGTFPQEELLVDLLAYARTYVPAYRGKSYKCLDDFPVLDKLTLRAHYDDYLSSQISKKDCVPGKTSGSTGTPLAYFTDPELVAYNYACTNRHLEYIGARFGNRKIRISGKAIAPPDSKKPPFWVYIQPYNQMQFSSYHIDPQTAAAYFKAISDFADGRTYGTGYAQSWFRLAELFQAEGLVPPPLKVLRLDSEGITLEQQQLVQSVFGCPVCQTYGLSEIGQFAVQCARGHYHIIPGFAYAEVLDEHQRACREGEIVITPLRGKRAPLIRYRTGDIGVLGTGECGCGMRTQYLTGLTGRIDDYILVSGRKIDRLSHLVKMDKGIVQSQIVQEDAHTLLFRIIPDADFSEDVYEQIKQNTSAYIDGMTLRFELVDELEKTPNGKARFVLRKFNPAETRDDP